MEKLTKKEVMHVAALSKLNIDEDSISKYQKQLNDILFEIEKIEKVKIIDEEFMINSSTNKNTYRPDEYINDLKKEDMLQKARSNGDFVEVERALND